MKKILAILLLVLVPILCFAGSAKLSWNAPTVYTDGSALPLSQIGGYSIYYTTTPPVSKTSTKIWAPITISYPSMSAMTYTISSLPSNTYYFSVTATSIYGDEGALAPAVSKFVTPGTPGVPTNLSVVNNVEVY